MSDIMQSVLKSFDADAFLGTEYTEALDTDRTLIPQGEVPIATIKDFEIIKPKLYTDADTGKQAYTFPKLRLHMLITDPGIRDQVNAREGQELIWKTNITLNINDEGHLDFGPNRNLVLGKLRAALGQNTPGVHWSFYMLKNCQPFFATCMHDKPEGFDNVFERITAFYKDEASKEDGQLPVAA